MATWRRLKRSEEEYEAVKKRREMERVRPLSTEAARPTAYQRAKDSAGLLSRTDVAELQGVVGNRAVTQLLSEQLGEHGRAVPSGQQALQRSLDEEEELPCPGSKIRSGGQGKGLGTGLGEGPVGAPTEEMWGARYGQGGAPIAEPEKEEWE